MKRLLTLPLFVVTLYCTLIAIHLPGANAENLSEGTYFIDYELVQVESGSVSIANDYFMKPAKLTIDSSGQYVQLTVNQSEWVKELETASGDLFKEVQVVSEDPENNKRVVAFKVDEDLSVPLLMQMHIVIEDMEPVYDHKYTVRLKFNKEKMEVTNEQAVVINASNDESITDETKVVQKDEANNKVFVYVLLTLVVILLLVYIRKFSKSKK